MLELENIRENIAKYTKEIEECGNAIFEYLDANSGIKSNIQRYQTMLEQNSFRKASLNQKVLKIKSEEGIYEEEISKCKLHLENVSDEILQYTKDITALEKSIKDTRLSLII